MLKPKEFLAAAALSLAACGPMQQVKPDAPHTIASNTANQINTTQNHPATEKVESAPKFHIAYEIADDIPQNERLDNPETKKLFADKLAELGYDSALKITITQSYEGPNAKSFSIYINGEFITGTSFWDTTFQNKFQNFVYDMGEPDARFKPLQEAKYSRSEFTEQIGLNITLPSEVDTPFDRKLLIKVLQEKGYSPQDKVRIKADKRDFGNGVVELYITIEINRGERFKGGGYKWDETFASALDEIAPQGNSNLNIKPDESALVELQNSMQIDPKLEKYKKEIIEELQTQGYGTALVQVEAAQKDYKNGVVEYYVLLHINENKKIKGGGYNWDDAVSNALKRLANND